MTKRQQGARIAFIKTVPWTIIDGLSAAVYGMLMLAVLGWFVQPSDMGLAGIALAISLLTDVVVTAGLDDAIIQNKSRDTIITDTASSLSIGFGIAGSLFVLALAIPVSALYSEPALAGLIATASLLPFVNSLGRIPNALLTRNMRARSLTIRSLVGRAFGLGAALALGLVDGAGYTLVAASVAMAIASTSATLIGSTRRPRVRLDSSEARHLLSFSLLIGAERILWSATVRLFVLLVGLFHGAAQLGLFQFAMRLVDEIASVVHLSIQRFGLALFSAEARKQTADGTTLSHSIMFISLFGLPCCIGIALTSHEIISTFFAAHWLPAAPFVSILAIGWAFSFTVSVIPPSLRAIRIQLPLIINTAIGSIIVLSGLYVAKDSPLLYVCAAWMSRQIFTFPSLVFYANRHLGLGYGTFLRSVLPALLGCLGLLLAFFLLNPVVPEHAVARLAIISAFGAVVYLSISLPALLLLSPTAIARTKVKSQ